MTLKTTERCDLYGCNRRQNEVQQTVTVEIGEETKTYVVCNFHHEMFEVMDPSLYSIGYTFTGEPEIRLHPAVAIPPA